MKVALVALMLLTACSPPQEKRKRPFEEGDLVRHKLTKQRGIVINTWGNSCELRLENGRKISFGEYELEKDQN